MAVNTKNKNKLIQNCEKTTNEGIKANTKTKSIHMKLTVNTSYEREPQKEVIQGTKQRAKTIILARHGMLECGSNFKGTMSQTCRRCKIPDDENHRLNECSIYDNINLAKHTLKKNFENVHSDDNDVLDSIICDIENIWELRYANGRMKK